MVGEIAPVSPTDIGGPCAKRVVTATVIAPNGDKFTGTNHCLAPQPACPRAGMPRYTGYTLCRSICQQPAHAEVNALLAAGSHARGATMVVEGIDHICDDCMRRMIYAGIASLVVGDTQRDL